MLKYIFYSHFEKGAGTQVTYSFKIYIKEIFVLLFKKGASTPYRNVPSHKRPCGGGMNDSEEKLIQFCTANDLKIMNTFIEQKEPQRKSTWISPDDKTHNLFNYIIRLRWFGHVERNDS